MSSFSREKALRHITTVGYLQPVLNQPLYAPFPDTFDYARHEEEGRDHDIE